MRSLPSICAILAAGLSPAMAEEFRIGAPVIQATVFPQGGFYTRAAEMTLPPGTHTVLIPFNGSDHGIPDIRMSAGVTVTAAGLRSGALVDPEPFYTDEQAELVARVEALEDRLYDSDTRLAEIEARIAAAEARRAFIQSIRSPTEEPASVEALTALAGLVQNGTAEVEATRAAAEEVRRAALEDREEIETDLAAARRAMADAGLPAKGDDLLVLDLVAETNGPAALEFDTFSGALGWQFAYDVEMIRGAALEIVIDRRIRLRQATSLTWEDVDLALATSDLSARLAPSEVFPDLASSVDPRIFQRSGDLAGRTPMSVVVAEEAEMVIMAEPAIPEGTMVTEGLAVRYDFPRPVTLASGNTTLLSLDRLDFEAREIIRAAPRRDKTAYLMAEFTNTSGAPILSSEATYARDGQTVGLDHLPAIAPGETVTLAFGRYDGILLDVRFDRNETGDRGVIRTQNERRQQVTFSVENLTGETQIVETLYSLPFSEQEDLRVTVSADPAPDIRDHDGLRGVSRWDMTLAPGEKREIGLDISMTWPEDQTLVWNP